MAPISSVTMMIFNRGFTLILLMALVSAKPWTTEARSLSPTGSLSVPTQTANLESYLSDVMDDPTCWDSLTELSACTGEVIMFFLNGETYLGPSCCEAIRTIDSRCSPMLIRTLLGYTNEEEDVLEGYCTDDKDSNGLPKAFKKAYYYKKVADSTTTP